MTATSNVGRTRTTPEAVRVFAVDDHSAFLATIAMVIEATPGFELVGTANSGTDALDRLTSPSSAAVDPPPVDLLLVDVVMAPMSGLELVERYRSAGGDAAVVAMSSYQRDDLPGRVTGLPDLHFIPKSDLHPEGLTRLWTALVAPGDSFS